MANAEREIRDLIGEWDGAFAAKDAARMTAHYAPDALIFDIEGQMMSAEEYRRHFARCFAVLPDGITMERRDLRIVAGESVAFMRCYLAMNAEGQEEKIWARATVCYRKTNDEWQVVHEHISVPFDFAAQRRIPLSPPAAGADNGD